jgi:UDP-3-O-[3-hydroxymyristoyl] glucosamine N-acyltransferase
MKISAASLAHLLHGEIVGNEQITVDRPARIEEGEPGTLTFLANPKYEPYLYTTRASIVLVHQDFEPAQPVEPVLIKVANVYEAMATLAEKFEVQPAPAAGISELSSIHPEAQVEDGVTVMDYVVVMEGARVSKGAVLHPFVMVGPGVSIGQNAVLHSGVKVEYGCEIGEEVIIHANSVIGSDGFGFAPEKDGTYRKIPQLGKVILGDNVEIGANSVVDCATLEATVIGDGTKIDNLVQVAHNVRIGRNTVIAGQAGIAGSTTIGDSCMLGGQSAIAGHLKITNKTIIGAQAGVTRSVTLEGETLLGSPAFKISDFRKSHVIFKRLPEINDRISALEKDLHPRKD